MFFSKRKQNTDPNFAVRHRISEPAGRSMVFSYHTNRPAYPDPKENNLDLNKQESNSRRSKTYSKRKATIVTLVFTILVLILVLINLRLSASPKIVIQGDLTSRVFLQKNKIYEQAAHKLFVSSVLNGNKITVDASNIAQKIHNQFPELAAVSIVLPFIGSQPSLYLLPATPQLILQDTGGGQFALNSAGIALVNAAKIPDNVRLNIPEVLDQSGLPINAGQLVLPNTSVSFITEVAGQLMAKNITATSYTLPAETSELDVRVAGEPYYVRFDLHGNAREEAGTFIAVKQLLDQTHKTPMQYVDVMVNGRAYYL